MKAIKISVSSQETRKILNKIKKIEIAKKAAQPKEVIL